MRTFFGFVMLVICMAMTTWWSGWLAEERILAGCAFSGKVILNGIEVECKPLSDFNRDRT